VLRRSVPSLRGRRTTLEMQVKVKTLRNFGVW
jgi:hypothetical protein